MRGIVVVVPDRPPEFPARNRCHRSTIAFTFALRLPQARLELADQPGREALAADVLGYGASGRSSLGGRPSRPSPTRRRHRPALATRKSPGFRWANRRRLMSSSPTTRNPAPAQRARSRSPSLDRNSRITDGRVPRRVLPGARGAIRGRAGPAFVAALRDRGDPVRQVGNRSGAGPRRIDGSARLRKR